jgi:hypothetical protein
MIRFCSLLNRVAYAAALMAVCTAIAQAQSTTSVVAFQGRVSLPSGEAPGDALYPMTFTLYDAPTGGTALWTESNSDKWICAASSADGINIAVAEQGGQTYTSSTAGIEWTALSFGREWTSIASSDDGQRIVDAGAIAQL